MTISLKLSSHLAPSQDMLNRLEDINHQKLTQLDDLLLEQNRGIKTERWNRNA
jgi:hypothetical protein